MMKLILTLIATLISINASAQTLQDSINRANADWNEADQNFKAQIANSAKYVPCDVAKSVFNRAYADWYRKNATEIFKHYQALEELFEYSNLKIADLREMTHTVLAVEGQNENQQVSFQKVIEYLMDLNIRAKASKKLGQYQTFKNQIADPMYSPFQLSLSQVIAAVGKMTENMNASLRARGVTFAVKYAEGDASFTFDLEIIMDQYKTPIRLSLLEGAAKVSLTSSEKWHVLSVVQVAGHSIDAHIRFNEFIYKASAPECHYPVAVETIDLPYVSPGHVKTATSNEGVMDVLMARKLVKGSVCTLHAGQITMKDGNATIDSWGSRRNAWAPAPVKVTGNRIEISWSGGYGAIWIAPVGKTFTSSHAPASCTLTQ